jgi:hypothetical protein
MYLHNGELTATWDGITLTPLPGLSYTQISDRVVWNEQPVYSGLNRIGTQSQREQVVTRQDGVWVALGGAFSPGAPWALAVWDGDLYAAGNIATIGGVPFNRVVRWNGTNWESLPPLADASDLIVFENRFYAYAGSQAFEFAGGNWIPAPHLEGVGVVAVGELNGREVALGSDFVTPGGLITLITRVSAGDVNLDGMVDLQDLATVLGSFGYVGGLTRTDGDLDGDASVGLTDLAIVLASFAESCE